jgi:hypothetical protein
MPKKIFLMFRDGVWGTRLGNDIPKTRHKRNTSPKHLIRRGLGVALGDATQASPFQRREHCFFQLPNFPFFSCTAKIVESCETSGFDGKLARFRRGTTSGLPEEQIETRTHRSSQSSVFTRDAHERLLVLFCQVEKLMHKNSDALQIYIHNRTTLRNHTLNNRGLSVLTS